MKQAKVKFPAKLADGLASDLYECDAVTILSWCTEDLFSEPIVTAVVVIPDDKVEKFNSSFGKYIVK